MTSPRIILNSLLLGVAALVSSCGPDSDAARLAVETRADEGTAQAYYNAGVAAQTAGRIKPAMKSFGKILEDYPQSPVAGEAAFRYAKLLEQRGEPLDAFEAYDAILTKYPASPHYAEAISRQEAIANQAAKGHIKNSFIGIKSRVDVKSTTRMLAQVRDNAPRALSAEKAQFAIGEVLQTRGSATDSIAAYQKLVRDYPESYLAAEAQYRIGLILLKEASDGNQDSANLDRAKNAFDDLLIRYPKSPRAKDAKNEIAKLASNDIQRSYDLAEFYRKKGQSSSALFYYKEAVRKSAPGPLRNRAQDWINQLSR